MKVYAWLIDLIHCRKNCPTGMISGWVQKVTEHRGTKQYCSSLFFLKIFPQQYGFIPIMKRYNDGNVDLRGIIFVRHCRWGNAAHRRVALSNDSPTNCGSSPGRGAGVGHLSSMLIFFWRKFADFYFFFFLFLHRSLIMSPCCSQTSLGTFVTLFRHVHESSLHIDTTMVNWLNVLLLTTCAGSQWFAVVFRRFKS